MHLRSFLWGLLVGVLLTVAVLFLFGDKILGNVGDTAKEVGHSVEKAGRVIEKQGDKLR